jgi:hypothetical protein
MQQMSSEKLKPATLNEICTWFSDTIKQHQSDSSTAETDQIIKSVLFLRAKPASSNEGMNSKPLYQALCKAFEEPKIMSENIKTNDENTEAVKFFTLLCQKTIASSESVNDKLFANAKLEYNNETTKRRSSKGFRASLRIYSSKTPFFKEVEAVSQRRNTVVSDSSVPVHPPALDLTSLSESSTSPKSTGSTINSPQSEHEFNINLISNNTILSHQFINGISSSRWQNPDAKRIVCNNPLRTHNTTVNLRIWDDVHGKQNIMPAESDKLNVSHYKDIDAFVILCDITDSEFRELLQRHSGKFVAAHSHAIFIFVVINMTGTHCSDKTLDKLSKIGKSFNIYYDYTQNNLNPSSVFSICSEIADTIFEKKYPAPTGKESGEKPGCLTM